MEIPVEILCLWLFFGVAGFFGICVGAFLLMVKFSCSEEDEDGCKTIGSEGLGE